MKQYILNLTGKKTSKSQKKKSIIDLSDETLEKLNAHYSVGPGLLHSDEMEAHVEQIINLVESEIQNLFDELGDVYEEGKDEFFLMLPNDLKGLFAFLLHERLVEQFKIGYLLGDEIEWF
ncbi:MAG: hypothetical protein ACRCW9_05960 [Cetobacterium sp.]